MSNIIWKSTGEAKELGKEQGESLWVQKEYRYGEEAYNKIKPAVKDNVKVDVLVIGAGMAGMLTAYQLIKSGKSVLVVDNNEAGGLITRNTTAKISSQHDLIYNDLITYKGEERAREYAMANQRAIFKYKEIIEKLNINCDYEVLPSYVYTLDDEEKIKKEVEAAKKLGIPAMFTRETTLPFKVRAAVKFDNQAQFHPLKFLDGLSKELTIYEHTIIKEIRNDGLITTNNGKIKAESVVMATHYPIINTPGYYFLKLHQERFYVAALEGWDNGKNNRLDGMYLGADPKGFSFRYYKDLLLLGTGNHRSGQTNPVDAYERIEKAKEKWYPGAKIKYAWSNQDCMTPDKIPYIGKYSTKLPNFYVATGFNKWGMTSSMAAASILSNMICKKDNPYKKVFYPQRLMFSGTKKMVTDTSIITVNLLSEKLNISPDRLKDIKAGKAGIIKEDGRKLGVYRDKDNKYFYVSTKCPHLGCSLAWNQNELTWDCPCHGSRFDYHGKLINNPATRDVFDACQIK